MEKKIHFSLNGEEITVEADPTKTLLWLLREKLGLTGTKEGCGAGECGACTILLNGQPVNSCLVLTGEVDGKEVYTIEGELENGELSDLQTSFIEKDGLQCGFCTPGMIMSARALLNKKSNPTRDEIIEAMQGNLCRCTGYESIINAVQNCCKGGEKDEI